MSGFLLHSDMTEDDNHYNSSSSSEITPFLPNKGDENAAGSSARSNYHHLSPADRPAAARRRLLARPALALLLAIGIFVAATAGGGGARGRGGGVISGGTRGDRAGSRAEFDKIGPMKTWECGTSSLPVLNSTDVVAYFSLEEGEGAVYGVQEHEVVFGGYLFRFVSAENKALFRESPLDYMPAWGGFCSYGIAVEDGWNPNNLGPHADPEWWLVTPDNVLRIFRSESPKKEYLQDLDGNTVAGDTQWREWFGAGTFPGADSAGTPLNTACICNSEICEDT